MSLIRRIVCLACAAGLLVVFDGHERGVRERR